MNMNSATFRTHECACCPFPPATLLHVRALRCNHCHSLCSLAACADFSQTPTSREVSCLCMNGTRVTLNAIFSANGTYEGPEVVDVSGGEGWPAPPACQPVTCLPPACQAVPLCMRPCAARDADAAMMVTYCGPYPCAQCCRAADGITDLSGCPSTTTWSQVGHGAWQGLATVFAAIQMAWKLSPPYQSSLYGHTHLQPPKPNTHATFPVPAACCRWLLWPSSAGASRGPSTAPAAPSAARWLCLLARRASCLPTRAWQLRLMVPVQGRSMSAAPRPHPPRRQRRPPALLRRR